VIGLMVATHRFDCAFEARDAAEMESLLKRHALPDLARMARLMRLRSPHYTWWEEALSIGAWAILPLLTVPLDLAEPSFNPLLSSWAETWARWRPDRDAMESLNRVLDLWVGAHGAQAVLDTLVYTETPWSSTMACFPFRPAHALQPFSSRLELESPEVLSLMEGHRLEETLPPVSLATIPSSRKMRL
jgi:hypothetical protein